jgi:hypothetical protein
VPDICPTPVYGPKLKIQTLKEPFYKRYLEYGYIQTYRVEVFFVKDYEVFFADSELVLHMYI